MSEGIFGPVTEEQRTAAEDRSRRAAGTCCRSSTTCSTSPRAPWGSWSWSWRRCRWRRCARRACGWCASRRAARASPSPTRATAAVPTVLGGPPAAEAGAAQPAQQRAEVHPGRGQHRPGGGGASPAARWPSRSGTRARASPRRTGSASSSPSCSWTPGWTGATRARGWAWRWCAAWWTCTTAGVELESEVGQGSRFTVVLPVEQPSAEPSRASSRLPSPRTPAPPGRGAHRVHGADRRRQRGQHPHLEDTSRPMAFNVLISAMAKRCCACAAT